MGGEGGLKHVVHKRVHLERHQPSSRKRLGFLEKHKDYVKRAADYHKKEKKIKQLQRQAAFKNVDEFQWGMISWEMRSNGRMRKKEKVLTPEEERLAESQDALYVSFREQADKKQVEKRQANLHFLGAASCNKHTIFVDDEDEVEDAASTTGGSSSSSAPWRNALQLASEGKVDEAIAGLLDTHPVLLKNSANRLRLSQLKKVKLKDSPELEHARRMAYKELLHRQNRAESLRRVREQLELRQNLRGKAKPKKVASEDGKSPASYKWEFERKR